jgi:hypothetical protein
MRKYEIYEMGELGLSDESIRELSFVVTDIKKFTRFVGVNSHQIRLDSDFSFSYMGDDASMWFTVTLADRDTTLCFCLPLQSLTWPSISEDEGYPYIIPEYLVMAIRDQCFCIAESMEEKGAVIRASELLLLLGERQKSEASASLLDTRPPNLPKATNR